MQSKVWRLLEFAKFVIIVYTLAMDDNPLSSDEESKIDHMNAENGAAPFDATQRREFLGGGGRP